MAAMSDTSTSPKPKTRPVNVTNIPDELAHRDNWMYWRWERKPDGKWTKPPYSPITHQRSDVTGVANHGTLEDALAAQKQKNAPGIGFSFLADGNLTFIDLDHCRDKETAALDQWAVEIVRRFPQAYVEISPSETGLHIIVKGTLPTPRGRKRSLTIEGAHPQAAIEMYCGGRYATITGNVIDDGHRTPGDGQDAVTALYNEIAAPARKDPPADTAPRSKSRTSINVQERLTRARNARNGEDFIALYDRGELGRFGDDHSRGDLALCGAIGWYMSYDAGAMDQAFRESALMRPKWDRVHRFDGATYGQMTIEHILKNPHPEGYSPSSKQDYELPHADPKTESKDSFNGTTGEPMNELKDRFMTAAELCALVPEDPDWVAKPFVVVGGITELTGQIKSGKSSLLGYLVKRLVDGGDFLGEETLAGPVVYLTEQNATTFREILVRSNLTASTTLHILTWHDARLETWPAIVGAAVAKAKLEGAKVLIVDTLPQFAGLRGDAENNAGDALQAIQPVQAASQEELAVIVVRHDRKTGGDVGNSSRGSNAFGGAVDIILQLKKAEGNASPTLRILSALSRFDDTPPELTIDRLNDGTYSALKPEQAYEKGRVRTSVLEVAPRWEAESLTVDDFCGLIPNAKRTTVHEVLKRLVTDGVMQRTGKGSKGDPLVFWVVNEPEEVERMSEPGAAKPPKAHRSAHSSADEYDR